MENSSDKGRKYIICVDDDRSLLDVLIQQLESAFADSYEIEGAERAVEAIELINELYRNGDNVEMVIADQVMPGMKDDQLLERIHKQYSDIICPLSLCQCRSTAEDDLYCS